MAENLFGEIIRIRPRPGAEARLLELRDDVVASYKDNWPGCESTLLLRPEEGDTWIELWYWESEKAARTAGAGNENTPVVAEWHSLVELVNYESAQVLHDLY